MLMFVDFELLTATDIAFARANRLLVFFAAAFWVLAISWALLALIKPSDETRPYVYAIRLVAFLLMIIGMVDKNRAGSR